MKKVTHPIYSLTNETGTVTYRKIPSWIPTVLVQVLVDYDLVEFTMNGHDWALDRKYE